MRARERWLRYKDRPCEREDTVGEVAQVVWPLILKAARNSPLDGRIALVKGGDPTAGLLKHLGGRPLREGRYYSLALQELGAAGLLTVASDEIVINGWKQYRPSAGGKIEFTWLKLFAGESQSFRLLPAMCRGFAHLLLRIADENGYVPATPAAIVDRLGWQTYKREYVDADGNLAHARRYLVEDGHVGTWVEMLFTDGYLENHASHPGLARIRNYTAFQPPTPRLEPGDFTATSRRDHGGTTAASRRAHGEKSDNHRESFDSPVQDPIRYEKISDPNPPNPPRGEKEGGGVFLTQEGEPEAVEAPEPTAERPPDKPPLPPDRPGWYRRLFAPYPRTDDELGAWDAAKKAASLAGGGDRLAAMTLERLPWQTQLTRWRKAGGQFIPSLANYLARGGWQNARPGPEAFADPPLTAEEREARRAAEVAKQRAAQALTTRAPKPKVSSELLRALWLRTPLDSVYRPPSGEDAQAIATSVLFERLAAFRDENASAPLPRLLAEFAASRGISGTRGPQSSENAPATPSSESPPASRQPERPSDVELAKSRKLLDPPLGEWNPEIPTSAAEALALLRRAAKRCEVVDARIRALER